MADSGKGDLEARRRHIGLLALGIVGLLLVWRCTKSQGEGTPSGLVTSAVPSTSASTPVVPEGLRPPIAAAHIGADVIVAGLDPSAKGIRVQRISSKDEKVNDRVVLSDVAWSADADLKVVAAKEGVAVTWRGNRAGLLVRQLVLLAPDLSLRGEPTDVAAASCATQDAIWFSDGVHALARSWTGAPARVSLPKEKDASLLCGHSRAFAVIEDEDKASVLALGDESGAPITMIRETDFGEDDQRELSEYTVGDDVGFVRLAASGALAMRELVNGTALPVRKLKSTIGKDDDVVAVDASSRIVVIVYTQDVSEAVAEEAGLRDGSPMCTRVAAVRVDSQSGEESKIELSPARCGYEVGPFFTSAVGDDVSVAWTERIGGPGRPRSSIAGLAHTLVSATAMPILERTEQEADALVDAGCNSEGCFAAALVKESATAKVLRYK